MDSKKKSSSVLEPDLIVQGDKVIYMSDAEQVRCVVAGMSLLLEDFFPEFRGGAL